MQVASVLASSLSVAPGWPTVALLALMLLAPLLLGGLLGLLAHDVLALRDLHRAHLDRQPRDPPVS